MSADEVAAQRAIEAAQLEAEVITHGRTPLQLREIGAACKRALADHAGIVQDEWPAHQELKARCRELEAQLAEMTAHAAKLEHAVAKAVNAARKRAAKDATP